MSATYWVGGTGYVTFPEVRQWQVRLNVAGLWGEWVDVAAVDEDRAYEAALEAYVMSGHDSRLMDDHINSSEILETK